MNFVFFGTPKVAADTLEILKSHGYLPSLIVTAPNKPVDRKQIITPPPVKVWAQFNNIPILQPAKLNKEFIGQLSIVNCQLSIVVAYGKIFPEWLINLPEYGTINVHYSLLPKYRGAAPVQATILNGDIETGVTIQKMVYELDAGPIVAQQALQFPISNSQFPNLNGKTMQNLKTPDLLSLLIVAGAELLIKVLPDYLSGKIIPKEQDHAKATFCPKIKKEDGLIDLNDDPGLNYNKYRAYFGWPRIYFIKDGKRIIITNAEFKDGKFVIKKILPEGKKEMGYTSFISKT